MDLQRYLFIFLNTFSNINTDLKMNLGNFLDSKLACGDTVKDDFSKILIVFPGVKENCRKQ
jgi:hypothetical protein